MILNELKNIKSTKKDLRNFGMLVGGVLLALGAILFWYGKGSAPYIACAGALLFACGVIFPGVLTPLQKVWMGLAVVMGFIMTRVILTLLFFIVITPLAVGFRLAGKRPLDIKMDRTKESYWHYTEDETTGGGGIEKQF